MISLILENIRLAIGAVLGNKMRALLTALGILIGILAVTLMGTLISGLDRSFERSMSFLGQDVLFIAKYEWFGDKEWWEIRNRPNIKLEYVDLLYEHSKYVKAVAPIAERGSDISRGDKTAIGVRIFGTTTDYLQTSSTVIDQGRFITNGEDHSGSRVTVIGQDVAETLFEGMDPIGKKVKIGGYSFRVIGVVEKQGKFLGMFSMDNQAIIPLGTHLRLFSRRGWVRLNVKVDQNYIEEAKDEIRGILRRVRGLRPHEDDDFAINQSEAFRKQYNMIKLAIGGTGMFITILSLVVGSIGIMNIMFVSVKERTHEIGIRKAIGATRGIILGQFLVEAILICLGGGLAGLLLAYGGSLLIDKYMFPSSMPLWLALGSMALSIAVGLISGIAPSYRAARMDPIESLRYE